MGRQRQINSPTTGQLSNLAAMPTSPPSSWAYMQQLLFVIRSADFAIDTDQAFTKVFTGTKWKATNISAVRIAGAYGVACLGGIYPAASKAGTAIVASTQTWAGLSGAGKIADATLAAILGTDAQTTTSLYLSLSTANTGSLTADVLVFGYVLD